MRKTIFTTVLMLAAVSSLVAGETGSQAQPTPPAANGATPSGKTITLDLGNEVALKLILIPAGKFIMGSPKSENGRAKNESLQHEVTITKPFYMGVYVVTQRQYEQMMGTNPSKFKGSENPVEDVPWDDAVEFCKKLSAKTGKTIHLPTEAQWEYACRAGSSTAYCNGDTVEDLQKVGWCSYDGKWGSAKSTKPVGSFLPNAWGLYDMHGNVWQWCTDWYADSYAEGKSIDPKGPEVGTKHVRRGGVWMDFPRDCRSAKREGRTPGKHFGSLGFRVVFEGD